MTPRCRSARTTVLFVLAVAVVVAAVPAGAQKKEIIDRYNISAMGTGHYGLAAGRTSRIELVVYRWNTPEERAEIIETIGGDDDKAIRRYLENLDVVGRIKMPGQSGVDLRYLWSVEADGQRFVTAAADRALASVPGNTTGNAPFYVAILQIALDENGEGKGVLAPGVYPEFFANGTANIKSTIASPVTLTKATQVKRKKK